VATAALVPLLLPFFLRSDERWRYWAPASRLAAGMPDGEPCRKPRFHAPVVARYAGGDASSPAFAAHLASLPVAGVGTVARRHVAGCNCVPVDVAWAKRAHVGGPSGSAAAADSSAAAAATPASAPARTRRRTAAAAAPLEDPAEPDGGLDDTLAAAAAAPAAPLRRHRRGVRRVVDSHAKEVLRACVRSACGLPSSTAVGKGSLPVSAVLVGDPQSGSRAILLRVGVGKNDSCILWASRRGRLLCSCFAGTQNALFLSASSRSTTCQHTTALRSCLSDANIPFTRFWTRMHLGSMAADFAVKEQLGSSLVWVVLYRSVFSLVSFSAANAATCIAPSCRRFRSRCGRVTFVRPLHDDHRATAAAGDAMGNTTRSASYKTAVRADQPPAIDDVPDDDVGIESAPCDTARSSTDAAEAAVSARVRRNMLPCAGEIESGDVWARTADWRGLFLRRASGSAAGRENHLATLKGIMEVMGNAGQVHHLRQPEVESYCGSCGRRRDEQHVVTKEAAVLYTHHPSAPAMQVCSLRFSIVRCVSGFILLASVPGIS